MPSGLTSTSSSTTGASRISDCSGVKDMLPRPWYERVQSMAGTPSVSGGASSRPSVRERSERASVAADSAVVLRAVGTGGALAGKEGVTVRCDVEDDAAGLAAVPEAVAGFAVVEVAVEVEAAAAALGVGAHAARTVDDAKLRCGIRWVIGADLEEGDAVRSAETPLRADDVAIVRVPIVGGHARQLD
jgi:hypothetical protein